MNKSEAGKLGYIASLLTLTESKNLRISTYYNNPKKCKNCANTISYEKRQNVFCSSSCAAILNNTLSPKRQKCLTVKKDRKPRIYKHRPYTGSRCKKLKSCVVCNISCRNRYCSTDCHLQAKFNTRYELFLSGKLSSRGTKSILIKQHGHKCMECGWDKINTTSNKCPVELEHIDGDSTNNTPENVKLLCPNCHSLTTTYKALNKGNGRYSRRQRYQDGKSF